MSYSCSHPLKGFQIGLTKNGKPEYKICSYKADHIEKDRYGNWSVVFDKFVSPYSQKVVREFTQIPCGKCIQCRVRYSREWAVRCMLEAQYHVNNYFITLTYDEDHVPKVYFDDDGETKFSYPLEKRDLQLFMKRLRKWYKVNISDEPIRFMACGEYGDQHGRCHFHLIAFGLRIPDLKFVEYSKAKSKYQIGKELLFESPIIEKLWGNGMVRIGACTFESCAYVARYVMKKRKGKEASFYDKAHIKPEFIVMSRRPGIAYQYFEDNKDKIYDFDQIVLANKDKVLKVKPVSYYDRLFDIRSPDRMKEIKDHRKEVGIKAQELISEKTSLSIIEYNKVRESALAAKMKKCERSIE